MKKFLIVLLVILIIIASIGVAGYFAYKRYKAQDPFELEWVRIYYDYMRENHENLKINKNGLKYYRENEKIEFCRMDDIKYPVMLYYYKELGVGFINIFYISENDEVKMLKPERKDFDVDYLYDVEQQKCEYYIHESYNDKDTYKKLSESIKINEQKEKGELEYSENVFVFGKEEKNTVVTLQGETLEIYKFDEKFIKTSIAEKNWKDINFDNYEDAIKKDFSLAYNIMQKISNDKVREEVEKREKEIRLKKEAMIKAKEEIKRKEEEDRIKAEEEARRQAEEEAKRKAEEEARIAEEEAKRAEEERKRLEEQNSQIQQQENANREL